VEKVMESQILHPKISNGCKSLPLPQLRFLILVDLKSNSYFSSVISSINFRNESSYQCKNQKLKILCKTIFFFNLLTAIRMWPL
jgi:hypothetical protein